MMALPDSPVVLEQYAAIPQALKERPAWVCWRYEQRRGKRTKVPYVAQPGPPQKAKSDTPTTWRTYAEAVRQASRFDGVGIMLAEGLAGADLDNSLDEEGAIKPWAEEIVNELSSYTEISPSGRGLKVFFLGEVPPGGNRRKIADGELELYSAKRFFTVTGRHFPGSHPNIEDRQAELESLHKRIFGSKLAWKPIERQPVNVSMSDGELVTKARAARNGDEFTRLWQGDYPEDDSAGDFRLCCHLAFWTGGDPARNQPAPPPMVKLALRGARPGSDRRTS
jgi:putative DNA primase/helicase